MPGNNVGEFGIYAFGLAVENAPDSLITAGFPVSDISVLTPETLGGAKGMGTVKTSKAPEGSVAGVTAGGAIGGTLGVLAERRRSPRNKFACFARFRSQGMGPAGPEWLCVTKDFSHDGIYFLAADHGLRESMQLLLSFPYNGQSSLNDRKYLVEVTRVKSLFQGRCGVGARLILRIPIKRHDGLLRPDMASSEHRLPNGVLQHIDLCA
jgi:hypothetical protein